MTNSAIETVDPSRTRAALRSIEPVFGAGVLSPSVHDALNELGLGLDDVGVINIVTRAAPMGPVNSDVVVATFYNANPALIESVIPRVWATASPDAILTAQREAFSPVLASALGGLEPAELAELAELVRAAGQSAATQREGRALFAGLVSLPWPKDDHMIVWHAAKLLREHRGDGHISTLVVEGLSGIEALVVHAAFDDLPADLLRASRRWDIPSWDAAVLDLRRRGWLTDDAPLTLTAWGRDRRQWMEDRTNELAATAYQPLGRDGMERMIGLGAKVVAALGEAGLASTYRPPPPGT
jgi:hypothetical protein